MSRYALHIAFLIGSFLAFAAAAHAVEPEYPREVARWQEVSIPPESAPDAREAWEYAASRSDYEWRVFSVGGQICAEPYSGRLQGVSERPDFTPKAGQFSRASSFARVDDGWLVAFNQGEFGAALYWFSTDGEESYKVSDDQVVAFISLPSGLHAIEGLAHMGLSEGSVIRITRPQPHAPWRASTVVKLPFAPFAVAALRDGTMLVTLSDSLVSIGANRKIDTLLSAPPWTYLYPTSSVLSADEQKLYIGMRQFVGEFDLSTRKLRLLIPTPAFLNELPRESK